MKEELVPSSKNSSPSEVSLFEPPKTLCQSVVQYLEKEIIEGKLVAGTRLSPDELSSRMNVSKSPIREALLCLEKDGLILNKARVGFFVADIKIEDIEEIYPIRATLIGLALKNIIEKGFKTDFIANIEQMLEEMKHCVQKNDVKGYFYLNLRFYDYILDCCPNRRVCKMLDLLGKQVLRFRFMSMSSDPRSLKRSFEGSMRLVNALKKRDIEGSISISEGIIFSALDALRQALISIKT
jgi:DNA-binding GntR family transcriptional regulator